MGNRDEFSEKTKKALAARAGWCCSFTDCGKLTVGPSEEAPDAIATIGEAAHTPLKQRILMRIELDVQGLGRWQGDVRVYIPTQEQMDKQAITRKQWDALLRGTRP